MTLSVGATFSDSHFSEKSAPDPIRACFCTAAVEHSRIVSHVCPELEPPAIFPLTLKRSTSPRALRHLLLAADHHQDSKHLQDFCQSCQSENHHLNRIRVFDERRQCTHAHRRTTQAHQLWSRRIQPRRRWPKSQIEELRS